MNRLAELLESAPVGGRRRGEDRRIGMVLLDLDRFKVVNESLGHAAGDALLIEVGRRLVRAARSTDTVTRLGSDEFGILLGPVRSAREAERVATRIEHALAEPFDLDGQEVSVGVSIGLTVGRVGETHAGDLLKEAEIALHRAKADPLRSVIVFDPDMRAQTLDRATMEHDLRRAIDRGELRLHYQPLVSLDTGSMVGIEALAALAAPGSRARAAARRSSRLRRRPGQILPDRALGARDRVRTGSRLAATIPGRRRR